MELHKHICICKKCGKEYEIECSDSDWNKGKYKKYCSVSCANSRVMTEERRQLIRNGIKKFHANKIHEDKIYTYICEKCGKEFTRKTPIKKGRLIHCQDCKQNRVHVQRNPASLMELSSRTVTKILYRAKCKCSICGWNESTCDIHHIIPRSEGGTNCSDNLIIVCPNCHRVIHTTDKYSKDFLQNLSVDKTFTDWKNYYHTKN